MVNYRKYTFATGLWTARVVLAPDYAWNPVICVGPGDVPHVAYQRYPAPATPPYNIYYRQYSGGMWQAQELVMTDTQDQTYPDITADAAGVVDVVWCGYVVAGANIQVRSKQRSAVGVWSGVTNHTTDAFDQHPASIVQSNDGNVHIVWSGNYAGAPGGVRQCRVITNIGGVWGAITILTATVNADCNPYALGGYNGGVNPATGYRFIYWESGIVADVMFYGDATDPPPPPSPLHLTAFVHPTGQAGYSPPPPPIVRETGEM
jgi:hypothetical protein